MLSFASGLSPNSDAFVLFVTEKYEYKDKKEQEIKQLNQEQDNFKKEIEKNKEDYEKIIEEAADEIENFVQKVSTENPIQ